MDDELSIAFEQLKNEHSFLKDIIDKLPASLHIIRIDKAGDTMTVWANKEYELMIGYTLEEREKLNPLDIYHPDDLEQVREAVRETYKGRTKGGVLFRAKCKDGNWKWMYIFSNRFSYQNDDNHLLCVGIEISREFSFNHSKAQEYMKEITRLKSQLNLSKLTVAENEIIVLLAQGKSVAEIAELRHRSRDTINNHKRNIFKKLGFTKLTHLTSFAIENGLV